jgi:ubiquinone/menaquinone biosynthesis C-methylase UbiE
LLKLAKALDTFLISVVWMNAFILHSKAVMNTQEAYNTWAAQYDSDDNKTRDLEGKALRNMLGSLEFTSCLEIGCGTGKNTDWLKDRVSQLTGVDLSEAMLKKAAEKIKASHVQFVQADITGDWNFTNGLYDLVSFSLVLEHIENLEHVFKEVCKVLNPGGYVYIGELHPFRQYNGSKARFENEAGLQVVPCYNHHVSDFTGAAKKFGLQLVELDESFDNDDKSTVPRILSILFQNKVLS